MHGNRQESDRGERRGFQDRRRRSQSFLRQQLGRGRRRAPRRGSDVRPLAIPDRFSLREVAKILLIIALSITDAILTLYLISHGAAEVNPVMAYFLEFGPGIFFGAKYVLTCASVVLLLLNQHAPLFKTRFRAGRLFLMIIGTFGAVILWELYLILFVVQ